MANRTEAKTLLEVLDYGSGPHAALVAPGGPTLTYDNLRAQVARLRRAAPCLRHPQGRPGGHCAPQRP